jgi:hypothetical protein
MKAKGKSKKVKVVYRKDPLLGGGRGGFYEGAGCKVRGDRKNNNTKGVHQTNPLPGGGRGGFYEGKR